MNTPLRGTLLKDEPLANYTTWRVGGIAKQLYKPADIADLQYFLKVLPDDEPVLWLGLGSNTLIRDGGFDGTVILTQGQLRDIQLHDNNIVQAQAGVACATMARFCARNHLGGVEFLAGIPGTIGGALRMNAGCFNGETWQWVKTVETIDRNGDIHHRTPDQYTIAYRSVQGHDDEWFLSAQYQLIPGDKEKSLQMIRDLLERRANTQPTNEANCGSVFRNPNKDHAARLIESCGLKGYQQGGATVSNKHANFIINEGEATAADIENLIYHVKQAVSDHANIELQQEVHIIGDKQDG